MVTPSFVMVGAPHFLSMTTLRPFGPRVTLTALASLSTPASRARRASSSNLSSLVIRSLHDREHVAAGQDEQLITVDGDLGATVLRVQHRLTDVDAERDQFAGGLGALAGADGEDLALLRLLLGGVGDDQAGCSGLLGLVRLDDDAVIERLQGHGQASIGCQVWTVDGRWALALGRCECQS